MATSLYSRIDRLASEDLPPVAIPGTAINDDIPPELNTIKVGGAIAHYTGYDQVPSNGVVRLALSPAFIPANKNDRDETPAPIVAARDAAPAEAVMADKVKQKFENRVPYLARMDVHRKPIAARKHGPAPSRNLHILKTETAHSQPVRHPQPAPQPPAAISVPVKYVKHKVERFAMKKALELLPALAIPLDALDLALNYCQSRGQKARRGRLKLECALNDAPKPARKTLEDQPDLEPATNYGPLKLALLLFPRPF